MEASMQSLMTITSAIESDDKISFVVFLSYGIVAGIFCILLAVQLWL